MDEPLNTSDSSHTRRSGSEWRMLGELTLSDKAAGDEVVRSWMSSLLQPLSLHPDFMDRIVASACDASTRAFQADAAVKCDHIHLLIYHPADQGSNLGTWGFFRVEKAGKPEEDASAAAHSIEFYLYMEGRS